jgi:hypothetical protein
MGPILIMFGRSFFTLLYSEEDGNFLAGFGSWLGCYKDCSHHLARISR